MNDTLEIGFLLQGIKIEQFAFFDENYTNDEIIELGTKFDIMLHRADRKIGIFFEVKYLQLNRILIKLVVSCHFIFTEESWKKLINSEKSIILFPKESIGHLAMITVGTARGILFTKTEGTRYSTFILPTLNIADMFKEDVEFSLESKHVETT